MAARRGKSQARRTSNNGTPAWVWLVAGAAIAAMVFLAAPNLFKKDGDGFLRVGGQPIPDTQPAPVADADLDGAAGLPRPAARNSQPAAKPASPQYDFYTLLPGTEVEMSDAELAASARAEEQRRAQAARAATATEAQRAQAALEGRPVPAAAAPTAALPPPVSEQPAAPRNVQTPPATVASRQPAAAPAATVAAPAAAPVAAPPTAASTAAESANVRYILQAGAFGASGDAEATKAKLAMMGLSARVESAQISGKTVYRVRMGPYGSAGELAEAKQKLSASGLPAMAIKAQ